MGIELKFDLDVYKGLENLGLDFRYRIEYLDGNELILDKSQVSVGYNREGNGIRVMGQQIYYFGRSQHLLYTISSFGSWNLIGSLYVIIEKQGLIEYLNTIC